MSIDKETIQALSQKIIENPSLIDDLSLEEVTAVRNYNNPYGNIIKGKTSYAVMSIINMKEQYMKRLLVTSMVGYLYRLSDEYDPDEEIEKCQSKWEKKMKDQPSSIRESMQKERDAEIELLTSTARGIVKRFLNRHFNYNPDKHLMKAAADMTNLGTKTKTEAIREMCEVSQSAPKMETLFKENPEKTYTYMRNGVLSTYQSAVQITETLKNTISTMIDPDLDVRDKQGILLKHYKKMTEIVTDMRKMAEPIAAADTLSAWKAEPPVDVFYHFNRYVNNHYEQLREVCSALYLDNPDYEFSISYYDTFSSPEEAREYRVMHENEFKSDVSTIENNGWTLLGPFKENRAKLDYYNKNTEVFKRLMEQAELDHKLGKDLMEKQVKAKKTKNVLEAGPDAPGLAAYSKAMNTVRELGAKNALTREEQNELSEANAIKEDFEVPDNAIQVDMFYPTKDSDGKTVLSKTKFYTQDEAPYHLQDGSPFADQYQPKREDGETIKTTTKTITSRDGRKMDIKVPKM
jgi:hypothetical protein